MYKKILKKVSREFQECFNEVLFYNFVLAWISSQLPEQKEGLFSTIKVQKKYCPNILKISRANKITRTRSIL